MFQSIKRILSEKTGAVAVLLMCIIGSFILIIGILIAASVSASGKSYADATLQISGKSILSEYDRKLLDEYGLLCFRGDETNIEKKLKFYANASFDSKRIEYVGLSSSKNKTKLLKLNMTDMDVMLKEYSMVNVDLYEKQIKEALKTTITDKSTRTENDKEKNRTLKNEVIIDSLPSAGYKGNVLPSLDDVRNLPEWEKVKNATTGKFARVEYVMKMFKHANKGNLDKDTFFNNEIEYILEGKHSDDANYSGVKIKIYAVRMTLNTAHIIANPKKMEEVTVLAAPAAAAAGIGMLAAEAAIIGTWAAAETENDIDLLEAGHNVAMVKTDSQWALNNPKAIVDGVSREKGVLPLSKNGQDYGDYLRVFLYLEDREAMLLRMMDLTQINMKGTYYRDFLLKEHFSGFRFNTVIKGDKFNYVQQY